MKIAQDSYTITGTLKPPVLRCRFGAPYVPLRAESSESVPVLVYKSAQQYKVRPRKNH